MNYAVLLTAFLQFFISSLGQKGGISFGDDSIEESDSCLTESRRPGECLDITMCKTLSIEEKLSPKRCGWKGDIPIICCPLPSTPRPKYSAQDCGIRPINRKNKVPLVFKRAAKTGQEVHVVGGEVAIPNSWPWMVSLRQGDDYLIQHRCGGCIIDHYHVLTAAHCFIRSRKLSTSNYVVKVGGHTRKEGIDYQVERVQIHPNFSIGMHYYDIAIVKVKGPIGFNQTISPACLPSTGDSYFGEKVTIIGWGDTSFGGISSNELQEAVLSVMNNSQCDQAYKNLSLSSFPNGITNSMLCAGVNDGSKDSCQGDSGGPLMLWDAPSLKWKIIGVVSFGYYCGIVGYPGVYTKVFSYLPWIEANTNS